MKRRERLEIGSNWQAKEHHAFPFVFTSTMNGTGCEWIMLDHFTVNPLNWKLHFPEFHFVNDSQWDSAKDLYLVWATLEQGPLVSGGPSVKQTQVSCVFNWSSLLGHTQFFFCSTSSPEQWAALDLPADAHRISNTQDQKRNSFQKKKYI